MSENILKLICIIGFLFINGMFLIIGGLIIGLFASIIFLIGIIVIELNERLEEEHRKS
jgi:hypothetical protein